MTPKFSRGDTAICTDKDDRNYKLPLEIMSNATYGKMYSYFTRKITYCVYYKVKDIYGSYLHKNGVEMVMPEYFLRKPDSPDDAREVEHSTGLEHATI